MGQVIKTKNYGDIEFEQTWVNGPAHVGKLVRGGYCHVSGLPIQSVDELRAAMRPGPDLNEAVQWFEHREEFDELEGKKRIVIEPDGRVHFDDDSEIEDVSDITTNIPTGPLQDAALRWWAQELQKKAELTTTPDAEKLSETAKKARDTSE